MSPAELAELAVSIREFGILQPLILTFNPDMPERYVLIAGHRRLEAARLAGLNQVPAVVREASEQDRLELALIENIQRTDLNPLEQAEVYRQLVDEFGLTHEEISSRVGKSRAAVTNLLRILKLPETIQEALRQGQISEGHARTLLSLPNPEAQTAALAVIVNEALSVRKTEELVRLPVDLLIALPTLPKILQDALVNGRISAGHAQALLELASPDAQIAVLEIVLRKNLTVVQTEELVKQWRGQRVTTRTKALPLPEVRDLEKRLEERLGFQVSLKRGRKSSTLLIHFYSDEDLDTIIRSILGE